MRLPFCMAALSLWVGLGTVQAAGDDSPAAKARALFARGLELAGRNELQAALQAFQDAYGASPNCEVWYNIGQAQIGLGQPQLAIISLSSYLSECGSKVTTERREQIGDQIRALEFLLGELSVTTDPAGALITVDGQALGRTPLFAPARLGIGMHQLTASLDGHASVSRSVEVRAGRSQDVYLQLPELPTSSPSSVPTAAEPVAMASPPPASRLDVHAVAPAPPPAHGKLRAALPYALAGTGAALGAGALGVYLWKRDQYHEWQAGEAALANEVSGSPSYKARVSDNNRLADSLTSANHAILGLGVAGGVLLAAGTTLYLLDRTGTRRSTTVTVAWDGRSSLAAGWSCAW